MRQGDVMKMLGLAGLVVAVGLFVQAKSGAGTLRSVSRKLRSIAGSAGDDLIGSAGQADGVAGRSGSGKRRTSSTKKASGAKKASDTKKVSDTKKASGTKKTTGAKKASGTKKRTKKAS